MKKGITLIELLSVIIILAIILTITIPRILNIIDNSKNEIIIKNNAIIVDATRKYLLSNRHFFPLEVGQTTEVTIEQLKENKSINEIINPEDKSQTCNGYVLITKISDDNFDYTPHIKCGIDIKNSEEDRLLTHYKFADFQEPTENLINPNPSFWGISGAPIINRIDDYTAKITSYERGEILDWWRAQIEIDYTDWNPGDRISVSFEMLNYEGRTNAHVRWHHSSGNTSIGNVVNFHETNKSQPGRYEIDFIVPEDYTTFRLWFALYNREYNFDYEQYITVSNVQVERKQYSTPFTDSSREGIVKDYSLNNNEFSLNLETTPKYTNQGYYFDNTYMQTNAYNQLGNANEFTYSFWMKAEEESGYILWKNNGILIDVGHASSSGAVRIRFNLDNDWRATYTYNYELNKWHHVVISWDNTNTKIYVDNELVVNSSADAAFNNVTSSSDPIFIGQRSDVYYFKGYLNNIRIYGRALSENEIRDIYIIEQREL